MIKRDDYDENGNRMATCTRCGMGWVERRESVELFGLGTGTWSSAGERPHKCPEPLPYETARYMADAAVAAGGIIVSQRQKAAIKLGLENGPPSQ